MRRSAVLGLALATFLGVSAGAVAGGSREESGRAPSRAATAADGGCGVFVLAPDGRFAAEFAKIDAYLNGQATGR